MDKQENTEKKEKKTKVDYTKDYLCLEDFTVGTKKPKEYKKGKTYKFNKKVGDFFARKNKLKLKK